MELMMDSREIRKEPAAQTPPLPAKPLRIASWNVRTLYEAGKTSELTNEMKRNKLDIILGVCETHLTDSLKKSITWNRGNHVKVWKKGQCSC